MGIESATRVAAIYDVHGNLPALEAVLTEVATEGVDQIVVGGDAVPGPMPRETLEVLRGLRGPVDFISGNGEREVLAELAGQSSRTLPEAVRASIRWSGEQLTEEQRRWISAWPATTRLRVEGLGDVLFCHATPESDYDIFTHRTPEDRMRTIFVPVDESLVVCGHTHMQFDRRVSETRVVNAGSVGMHFGATGAHWLLLGGAGVQLRRTDYDLAGAADRIRASDYPQANEFAERYVLDSPSEEDMLRMLEPSTEP